jgi:hypothetical protein
MHDITNLEKTEKKEEKKVQKSQGKNAASGGTVQLWSILDAFKLLYAQRSHA